MRCLFVSVLLLIPTSASADDPDPIPIRETNVSETEEGICITINAQNFGPYTVPTDAIVFDETKTHFAFIQPITSHRWLLVVDGQATRYQGPERMDNVRFTSTGAVRFDQYWRNHLQTLQVMPPPAPPVPGPVSAK